MTFRDRIKDFRRVSARDLHPSPRNWRTHPDAQRLALAAMIGKIGIADAAIARELPDGSLELIDGHLRADLLGAETIPVLVLDVDQAEADQILATLDPLAGMAGTDSEKLSALLDAFGGGGPGLESMLAGLRGRAAVADLIGRDDVVDKSDRAGSSPWSRIEGSETVRCLVGDVEFGVLPETARRFAEAASAGGAIPRERAREIIEGAVAAL